MPKSQLEFRESSLIRSCQFSFFLLLTLVVLPLVALAKDSPQSNDRHHFRTIHIFKYDYDGAFGEDPRGGLVMDPAGNLYGTTASGGTNRFGTVYELSPTDAGAWTPKVLHNFDSTDGSWPLGDLVFDSAGNIFGTTSFGGANDRGVAFKLTHNSDGTWSETVLHEFGPSGGADASWPSSGVIFDTAGNLYGVTSDGPQGAGTAYELSPDGSGGWTETILASISYPQGGLVLDASGNLYGTTWGSSNFPQKDSVFQLSPSGGTWTLSIIYSFAGGKDGSEPIGRLVFDGVGKLYGTTSGAETCPNCPIYGTVYQLTPEPGRTWTEKVLATFPTDSFGRIPGPTGGVVLDAMGNVYCATYSQGEDEVGAVYRISPNEDGSWTQTLVHSFHYPGVGDIPQGDLFIDSVGNIFGTTTEGGRSSFGSVFELRWGWRMDRDDSVFLRRSRG